MKRKQTSITNEAVVANPGTTRKSAPHPEFPDFLQRLHTTAGNRAAGHWVQAKLKIGAPNDAYEREANRVADQVTSTSDPATVPGKLISDRSSGLLQGKCGECDEDETQLRRQETGPGPAVAPPIVTDVLNSPGQPLDSATRNFMEPRFGKDFSDVRIHTGAEAVHSARSIDAFAYTAGDHVV